MIFRNLFENPVQTPWHRDYRVAGVSCSISTNSESILAAARDSFTPLTEPQPSVDISMRFWVDLTAQNRPRWRQPYFRGLSHLVFGAFNSENTMLADLRRQRAVGRFSPAMAADHGYWRRVVFPTLFGIFSQTVGITALHCACVEREGRGLLLAGVSGSGKSTLALALAQSGFAFLSDDWTYFSRRDERLLAWGLTTPLKLLPGATEYFPELALLEPGVSLNGELAYEVEPENVFGVRRSSCAEPHWLVFLERQEAAGLSLSAVSSVEAAARLEENLEDLPLAASGSRDLLVRTIRVLARRECLLLRYGGAPRTVARQLADLLGGNQRDALLGGEPAGARGLTMPAPDLLRRFTPTPLTAELRLMGRAIRLESNSAVILERMCRALNNGRHAAKSARPEFLWRLVSDAVPEFRPPWPELTVFSHEGLSFVNIGQGGFLAVDLESREAVGFLAEELTKDELGFTPRLLAVLFSLTASALGLTAEEAAALLPELRQGRNLVKPNHEPESG
jgi:hypothetical protein